MNWRFYKFLDFVKTHVKDLFSDFLYLIKSAFYLIRVVLYRVILFVGAFTRIGLFVGLVFLVLNIIECNKSAVHFFDTSKFKPMCVLICLDIIVEIIARVVKPKDYEAF